MSAQDRMKWNARYKEKIDKKVALSPNEHLKRLSSYFHGGECLDLACGLGANSLYLAKQGFKVTALDISDTAIKFLQETAARERLAITAKVEDFDQIVLPDQRYDLIVDTFFLDRKLFPIMKSAVKWGGLLFMETFLSTGADQNQHVRPAYKLESGELKKVFSDWEILYFFENQQSGTQAILARKIPEGKQGTN